MVRAPQKTCPTLSRLIDDCEIPMLAAFLSAPAFERTPWLDHYRPDPEAPNAIETARRMLLEEKKSALTPLETEAARIVKIASSQGEYALDGLARTKLDPDRHALFRDQRDALARSLWIYVNEHGLFEAAENSLHMRLYRRYDKHYQTFPVDQAASGVDDPDALDRLLEHLKTTLDRGDGYAVERYDIPPDRDEPAEEMYILYHPNPPTSVREIDDDGNRTRLYFRPPGEAMVVYTPLTGRVHVRAGTRVLRHKIADGFIEQVLGQEPSRQPVDFQAHDLRRFFQGFDLELPDLDELVILRAQVVKAEVSIGSLANRLSLSTTINEDISAIIENQPGLGAVFKRAIAIRFVEFAIRFRRAGRDEEQTLNFTVSDRNTSSLLSIDDPFERTLGRRLLQHWGVLQDGRAPTDEENKDLLPALLALWDIGADRVAGAWLHARNIDPTLLVEVGFLAPKGWEDEDVIDDDDLPGPMETEVIPRPEGPGLQTSEGQETPGGSPEMHRVYRVRTGWVAEHLKEQVVDVLDRPALEEIGPNLIALGFLRTNDRETPIYLARRLHDEKARAAVDTELRARSNLGIGLVLQAGSAFGNCLAANVLAPVLEHVADDASEIALNVESLKSTFRLNRIQATGGLSVELRRSGKQAGTLLVPTAGAIDVIGENRLIVIERLVDAHNSGSGPVATGDLIQGFGDQSLSNIFGSALWRKLKSGFVRSPSRRLWEIAA